MKNQSKAAIDKQESYKAFLIWEQGLDQYFRDVPEAMTARIFPQVLETAEGRENEGEEDGNGSLRSE